MPIPRRFSFLGDSGNRGVKKMAGTSGNGVLGVPRGIPSCGAGGSLFPKYVVILMVYAKNNPKPYDQNRVTA